MKQSTSLLLTGIALLFLAFFYSVATMLASTPNVVFKEPTEVYSIFHMSEGLSRFQIANYWVCEILGIACLIVGFWKTWKE